jgi:cob(I)alamin adenosyltransferase
MQPSEWPGDNGKTKTADDYEVSKDSAQIEANGAIDELSSFIGLARVHIDDSEINTILKEIQGQLFTMGADLAKSQTKGKKAMLKVDDVKFLEDATKRCEKELRPLDKFIIPGGSPASALLHVCRSVARRAERRIVFLKKQEIVNEEIPKYLNRLSYLLFILARLVNQRADVEDEKW